MAGMTDDKELELIECKIEEILTIGQAYTVVGSRTITNPAFAELQKERRRVKRRIRQKSGFKSRNIGEFQTMDTGDGLDADQRRPGQS